MPEDLRIKFKTKFNNLIAINRFKYVFVIEYSSVKLSTFLKQFKFTVGNYN